MYTTREIIKRFWKEVRKQGNEADIAKEEEVEYVIKVTREDLTNLHYG